MKEFPTQQVLELACAAQRANKSYIKESENVYDNEGKFLFVRHTNKDLIKWALNINRTSVAPEFAPQDIFIQDVDKAQAEEIKKYYKRLLFAAIEGDNDFLTTVNSILGSETVKENQLGYVACLPSVQARDLSENKVKRASRTVENGYLADIGAQLKDLDAEILSSVKSKNFDGYNIDAIINNKMVSWINKTALSLGACVVVKAKVRDHAKHWKHQNDVTRLNYVKAAQ